MNVQGKMLMDTASIIENKATLKTDSLKNAGDILLTGNAAQMIIDSGMILQKGVLQLSSNKLVLLNGDTNALQVTEGKLIAEDSLWGKVVWHIGENTGKYKVPFVNDSLQDVGIEFEVIDAGDGSDGYLEFSTFETVATDSPNNAIQPPDMLYFQEAAATVDSNWEKIADRYWLTKHAGFGTPPLANITLHYDSLNLAGLNLIDKANLRLSRLRQRCWEEVPYQIDTVQRMAVADTLDDYSIFMLHETIVQEACYSGLTCEDAIWINDTLNPTPFLMTDTVMWFRFVAFDTLLDVKVYRMSDSLAYHLDTASVYKGACDNLEFIAQQVSGDSSNGFFIRHADFLRDSTYQIRLRQNELSGSFFTIIIQRRDVNNCSAVQTCNAALAPDNDCNLICNPQICVPGAIPGRVTLAVNIPGWDIFFGTPDYNIFTTGIDPANSGALRMFSNPGDSTRTNCRMLPNGEGVYTPVNIEGGKSYLFSYYRQIPSPNVDDIFVRAYNSADPPTGVNCFGDTVNFPYYDDSTLAYGSGPRPQNFQGLDILTENQVSSNNLYERVITCFATQPGDSYDNLVIYPAGETELYLDQIELIEDDFSAGHDQCVISCIPDSATLGGIFCEASNTLYEWSTLDSFDILSTSSQMTVRPLHTTTYVLRRFLELFDENNMQERVIYTPECLSDTVTVFVDNGSYIDFPIHAPGDSNEQARGIAFDDGVIYVTGVYNDSFHFPNPYEKAAPVGLFEMFLAKYDDCDETEWVVNTNTLEITSSIIAEKVQVDNSGNVIVAGYFNDSIEFTGTGARKDTLVSLSGSNDLFVAKYAADGNLIWVIQDGGTNNEGATNVAVDAQNNIVVVGTYSGATVLAGTNRPNAPMGTNGFIVKYDSTGRGTWSDELKNRLNQNNVGSAVGVDIYNDSIFIAGIQNGEIYIEEYEPNGTSVFHATYPTGLAHDLAVDTNGNFYVTGEFSHIYFGGAFEFNADGNGDAFVTKFNSAGQVQWVHYFGGDAGSPIPLAVTANDAGDVFITGAFIDTMSFHETDLISVGEEDIFIVKYAVSGNPRWGIRAGGTGGDKPQDIITGSGCWVEYLYLTGVFYDSIAFNSILTTIGGQDFFAARIEDSGYSAQFAKTARDKPENEKSEMQTSSPYSFQLYPNPASNTVIFETDYSGEVMLTLYDIVGMQKITQTGLIQRGEISLNSLAEGAYIYLVRNSGKSNKILHRGKLLIIR